MRWLPGSLATPTRQPLGAARVASGNPFARGFVFVGASTLDAVSGTLPQTLTNARVSLRAAPNGLATYINDAGGAGSNLSFGPDRAACMSGATQGTWVVQFVLDNASDSPHLFGSWNLPSTNHWLIQVNGSGLIWIPADEGASNRRRWDGSGLFTAGRLHTLALVWNGGASYVAFLDGREITLSAVDTTANSIRPAPSFIHMGNYLSGAANRFSTLLAACTPVAVNRLTAQALSVNPWPMLEQPARPLWAPATVTGGGVTITVQDAAHAHAAGNLGFTLSTSLAVAAATHAHTAENLTLTAQWLLTVAAAVHAQAADNLTLTVGGSPTLSTADAQHAHAADNLALSLAIFLALQDASHAHAASNVALVVADANADLALAIKIIKNRKQLNPTTGLYTVFDDDGITPLLQAAAWVDPAGTIPYSGGLVQRVDRLEPI